MIHVVEYDGSWEVWTDTEVSECDGRCIGSSRYKSTALVMAGHELRRDLEALQKLTRVEFKSEKAKRRKARAR